MIELFVIIAIIAVNVVLLTCLCVNEKRNKVGNNLMECLRATVNMISALDNFRKNIPQMSEEFVSDVKPAIDSYIKERVEAYLQSSPGVVPTVTDIQELDPIREPYDNLGIDRVPCGGESEPDYKPLTEGLAFEEIEAAIENACAPELYKDTFLHEPEKAFRASTGKQVNIRPEYHRNILLILEAAGCDCVTLTGFIDNVLAPHFKNYGCNIGKIINSRFTNPESL